VNANPKRYIPSHSGLIAQISCTLAVAMEWHSETTFYKLNLAAFLHDITLDNHALAAIRTMDELNARRDQFKPQEYKDFQNHAMRAAELARQFNEVPPDVDSIIAQHHEQPDGSGFPRGLTHTHISPLGALFIVAHDLISFVFEKGGPSNIDLFLQEFLILTKDRYAVGNFKKIHKALGAIQTGE
ncbi:MAG: HD-GYP domain-containing protein, partial [Bacteriovoracia bacterium]